MVGEGALKLMPSLVAADDLADPGKPGAPLPASAGRDRCPGAAAKTVLDTEQHQLDHRRESADPGCADDRDDSLKLALEQAGIDA